MILKKLLFANFFLLLSFALFNSCQTKGHNFVLRIKIECTPILFVDSIKTILLTDTYSDFGGNGGSSIFGPGKVVDKNVKRSLDNYFYLSNVKRAEYAILYLEGYVDNVLYTGHNREVNFSQTKSDTLEIKICYKPNMTIIQGNQSN